MSQPRFGAGCLVVAVSLAASGVAHGESELSPGDRIRVVSAVGDRTLTGTLVAVDAESMSMVADKSRQRVDIRRESITQLERLVGKKRYTVKGALIGALAGAGLMALYFSGDNDLSQNSGTGDVIGGVAFFLLPPAGVGALVGTMIHQDRWVRVPPSHVGTVPEGRINVGVTIRF